MAVEILSPLVTGSKDAPSSSSGQSLLPVPSHPSPVPSQFSSSHPLPPLFLSPHAVMLPKRILRPPSAPLSRPSFASRHSLEGCAGHKANRPGRSPQGEASGRRQVPPYSLARVIPPPLALHWHAYLVWALPTRTPRSPYRRLPSFARLALRSPRPHPLLSLRQVNGAADAPVAVRASRDLKSLYDQLMQQGAILDAEFWASRQNLLAKAKGKGAGSSPRRHHKGDREEGREGRERLSRGGRRGNRALSLWGLRGCIVGGRRGATW